MVATKDEVRFLALHYCLLYSNVERGGLVIPLINSILNRKRAESVGEKHGQFVLIRQVSSMPEREIVAAGNLGTKIEDAEQEKGSHAVSYTEAVQGKKFKHKFEDFILVDSQHFFKCTKVKSNAAEVGDDNCEMAVHTNELVELLDFSLIKAKELLEFRRELDKGSSVSLVQSERTKRFWTCVLESR